MIYNFPYILSLLLYLVMQCPSAFYPPFFLSSFLRWQGPDSVPLLTFPLFSIPFLRHHIPSHQFPFLLLPSLSIPSFPSITFHSFSSHHFPFLFFPITFIPITFLPITFHFSLTFPLFSNPSPPITFYFCLSHLHLFFNAFPSLHSFLSFSSNQLTFHLLIPFIPFHLSSFIPFHPSFFISFHHFLLLRFTTLHFPLPLRWHLHFSPSSSTPSHSSKYSLFFSSFPSH